MTRRAARQRGRGPRSAAAFQATVSAYPQTLAAKLDDVDDDPSKIGVGDFYEDCTREPRVCVLADYDADELAGISLITGDVGSCSVKHCGVVPTTALRAVEIALAWPPQHNIDFAREHDQLVPIPGNRVPPEVAQAYRDGLRADPVLGHRLGRLQNHESE